MRILFVLPLLAAVFGDAAHARTLSPTGEVLSNFDVPPSAAAESVRDPNAGAATGQFTGEKRATILPSTPSELGTAPSGTGNIGDPLNEAYLPKAKATIADPSAAVNAATSSAPAAVPDSSKTTAGDAERTNTFHGLMTTMCTTVNASCRQDAASVDLASQAANLKEIKSQCKSIGQWYPKLCAKLTSLKDATKQLCPICKGWYPGSLTEPLAKWVDPTTAPKKPVDPQDPHAGKHGYLATDLNANMPIDKKWNNVDLAAHDSSDSVAVNAADKYYTRLGAAQQHVEHAFMNMYNRYVMEMESHHQSQYAHDALEKMTARVAKVMNLAKEQTNIGGQQ